MDQLLAMWTVSLLLVLQLAWGAAAVSGTQSRGMRAALVHRDHVSNSAGAEDNANLSPAEKFNRDAKRSVMRGQALSRKRRLADTWETPLSNLAAYEYLMEISLGTPPQTLLAVADTGSDLTWLQCIPCREACTSFSPYFDPSISSTYSGLSCSSAACEYLNETSTCPYAPSQTSASACPFAYYYADSSETSGALSTETITLETVGVSNVVDTIPNFWFGCSDSVFSNSGLLDQSSGLVGLGQGLVSFPRQLGHYYGDKFSYCLVNRLSATVETSPLIFGEAAVPSDPNALLQWTPIISNPVYPYFYYVGLEGIAVDGFQVNFSAEDVAMDTNGNGGFIFDSGTTYSSLVDAAYEPLLEAIASRVTDYTRFNTGSEYFELCYSATWSEWRAAKDVPRISYLFANNTNFKLAVDNSWFQYDSSTVCLAILRSTDSRKVSYFGNVQQTDFQIVYDRLDAQIGFVQANCSSL